MASGDRPNDRRTRVGPLPPSVRLHVIGDDQWRVEVEWPREGLVLDALLAFVFLTFALLTLVVWVVGSVGGMAVWMLVSLGLGLAAFRSARMRQGGRALVILSPDSFTARTYPFDMRSLVASPPARYVLPERAVVEPARQRGREQVRIVHRDRAARSRLLEEHPLTSDQARALARIIDAFYADRTAPGSGAGPR